MAGELVFRSKKQENLHYRRLGILNPMRTVLQKFKLIMTTFLPFPTRLTGPLSMHPLPSRIVGIVVDESEHDGGDE